MDLNVEAGQARAAAGVRLAVVCAPGILDQIHRDSAKAFYSVPHGGMGAGGVLYGTLEGSRVLIQAARQLQCEHAFGPSFTLSEADFARFAVLMEAPKRERLLAGMTPVGWYHSQTRSDVLCSEHDREIHDRLFPKAWQVALVLRLAALHPTRINVFARDAGELQPLPSFSEVTLPFLPKAVLYLPAERTLAPRSRTSSAPRRGEPEAPAPDESFAPPTNFPAPGEGLRFPIVTAMQTAKRSWLWLVAAVVLLCAVAAYVLVGRSQQEQPGLQLQATDRDGQLDIRWDGQSSMLRGAHSGSLEITDGAKVETIPLDEKFLRSGSVLYTRRSSTVRLHFMADLPDGSRLEQYQAFVGEPPPAAVAGIAEEVQLPKPAAGAATDSMPSEPVPESGKAAPAEPIPAVPSLPAPSRATVDPPRTVAQRPAPSPARESAAIPARPSAQRPLEMAMAAPPPVSTSAPPVQTAAPAPAAVIPPPPPAKPAPEAAPASKPEPPKPAAPKPPSLSGEWAFVRGSASGSPFPPESVSLSLFDDGDVLQGSFSGRYRAPKSSGTKQEVRFSFAGRAGTLRFPWAAADGTKGTIELVRVPNRSDSLEVVWYSQDRKLIFDDVLARVSR